MAYQGRTDQAKCLLMHGADATVNDNYDRSPLCVAITARRYGVTRTLLDMGIEPDGSALRACAANPDMHGFFSTMVKRVSRKHMNGLDTLCRTALDIALEAGNKWYVSQLLNNGARSGNKGVQVVVELFNSLHTDFTNMMAVFPDMLARSHAPN
jgi:ankyrin repeat protein